MDEGEDAEGRSTLWLTLQKIARGAGIQRNDLLQALAGELSELRCYWGVNLAPGVKNDRETALRKARNAIVLNLYTHFDSLQAPRGVSRKKFLHALVVSFNIQGDKIHACLQEADLSQRRDWLAKKAPTHLRVSLRTSQRYLKDAISQIEQQILDSDYQPADTDSAPEDGNNNDQTHAEGEAEETFTDPFLSDSETPYVRRLFLSAKLAEFWIIEDENGEVSGARRRVCLIGDAGTGKSRLIWEMLSVDGVAPLWIDASTDGTSVPRMWEILREYQSDVSGLTDATVIKKAFGRLLAHPDGPAIVVIDGIPDPGKLDQFIPHSTNTYIFITSRCRPPRDWPWPVLEVGGMEEDEAQRMITLLLPDASVDDSLALAIALGSRPLLIEHACAFISRTGVGVREFCATVSQDVINTLNGMDSDRTLTAIYELYKRKLAEEAPESLRLLELLPFIAPQYVPPEYLMAYLLGVPYIKKEQLVRAQLAYEAAIRPLEAYSLVSVHDGLGVSMRPFVQHVLRRIFADRLVSVVILLHQMSTVSRKDLYAEGWSTLTVVGRETCSRVVFTHLKDRFMDGGKLTQDGTIGGVQWGLLVAHLWIRHFKLEFIQLVAEGTISLLQGSNGEIDWSSFLEGGDDLPPMQRNERLGVIAAARSIIPPAEEADTVPGSSEPMSNDEFWESALNVMLRLTKRYEDSQLGPLDLRLVNTWSFDPEQQDELRALMRETIRTARQDADEGAATEDA